MAKSKARRRPTDRPTYPDLKTYIEQSGDTQAHIARRCGASQAHVSRIANGDLVPRPLLAARLAAYARVPLDSFTRTYLARQGGTA
jgi:transcriptional regulator with XRE-family HTH domain